MKVGLVSAALAERKNSVTPLKTGLLQRAAINPLADQGVPPIVHDVLRSPGRPLEAAARSLMEPRFGYDFSGVRIHTDPQAAESAEAVHALAYTVGRDIVFGTEQYAPHSSAGQRLMAHEFSHVIQQDRVKPPVQSLSIGLPTSPAEREANSVADAYLAGEVLPALGRVSPTIQRQPQTGQAQSAGGGTQTITDPDAVIRDGPDDFKATDKKIPVGTRVDVIDTHTTAKGTFVNVVEHGTGKALGWTAQANLGNVQYAKASANFVYIAKLQPRTKHPDTLPIMVYLPPHFDGTQKADILVYFHGDAADYSASTANNYSRENPAIGMNLASVVAGANRIIIAPQVNEFTAGGASIYSKSPWNTLHAGDYETIVQTVLANLQSDLNLKAAIPRGAFSIAGHSGGGKALGQAVQDLDQTGSGVTDVTLVEAGYGGGEDAKGKADGQFAQSFQLARDWLLEGRREKVLRIITKATSPGTDTRHAIENDPAQDDASRITVLSLTGIKNAIKAKGLEAELQADATELKTDPQKRTGDMKLFRKIVISHKSGGKIQGTIYMYLMADPPRDTGVDTHFGVRAATIRDIASGGGQGDNFAVKP